MDAKYFCDTMQSELVGMKARVYDIISSVESMPGKQKEGLKGKLPELQKMVGELAGMIDRLRVECPVEFSAEKKAIEAKKRQLLEKINIWDEEHIAGGYVGG